MVPGSTDPRSINGVDAAPAGGWLRACAGYLLLWALLTGGAGSTWVVGLPVTLLAAALTVWLPANGSWRAAGDGSYRRSPRRRFVLLRFPLFFVTFFGLSLRAGIDVMGRALVTPVRLAPGMCRLPLRLPPGTARHVFMLLISLVPGTLTADLVEDVLMVHVLDQELDNGADLRALEEDVAWLFGMCLPAEDSES